MQCEQLFHTEPDDKSFPAPKDCHLPAWEWHHMKTRKKDDEKRRHCRDECRQTIWTKYGEEDFPAKGPAECTGSQCSFKVDPAKLDQLFEHGAKWWEKNGDGKSHRPEGQCDTWLDNDVCKRNRAFMLKACPGKCPGDDQPTVDEEGTVDE
jgi:hypothetical protein